MKKRCGHSQEGINRDYKTMRFTVEMMKRQYAFHGVHSFLVREKGSQDVGPTRWDGPTFKRSDRRYLSIFQHRIPKFVLMGLTENDRSSQHVAWPHYIRGGGGGGPDFFMYLIA
ncbi:hypothetical protein Peur_013423 [Populus x canadensis]